MSVNFVCLRSKLSAISFVGQTLSLKIVLLRRLLLLQIKTHLQSRSVEEIAVGHQHAHQSMTKGLLQIHSKFGILGLWRGVSAAIPRVMVGSASQLSTFSNSKNYIEKTEVNFFIGELDDR